MRTAKILIRLGGFQGGSKSPLGTRITLRKHVCRNILKLLPSKTTFFFFRLKFVIFQISAQNRDCRYCLELPRQGGSNEYPQTILGRKNKKNNQNPFKPQFYYINVGFKGVKIIKVCFCDEKLIYSDTSTKYFTDI